jgi:hypothetical protein
MNLSLKNRLEGTKSQQRALVIHVLALRILAAKRSAQK